VLDENASIEAAIQHLRQLVAQNIEVVQCLSRTGRFVAKLSDGRMAFIAKGEAGLEAMNRESILLDVLNRKVQFSVPQVADSSADGSIQIRHPVLGSTDLPSWTTRFYQDLTFRRESLFALTDMLAELHQNLEAEASSLAPSTRSWSPTLENARERLSRVITSDRQRSAYVRHLEQYQALEINLDQRVLCHGDVGFHNIAYDPKTYRITGLFDFYDASYAEPEVDLRYLVTNSDKASIELLNLLIERYNQKASFVVTFKRVMFYNALSAIAFLANRDGVSSETVWCGRTFDEDVAWVDWALDVFYSS
jgi:aminoglycoside phosphotransferase (APT) family kinase protein